MNWTLFLLAGAYALVLIALIALLAFIAIKFPRVGFTAVIGFFVLLVAAGAGMLP